MTGRPDVGADATVDFDHHSDEFNLNELAVNADLRRRCPVAWNENYGGFWFVTSYDAVEQVARDGDTFAHKYEPNAADGVDYQGEMGVPRPEGQPPLGIGEVDDPTIRRCGGRSRRSSRLEPSSERCHSPSGASTGSSISASQPATWISCA